MIEPNMKDYNKEYAAFKWELPEKYNFGFDVIEKRATTDRNKLALITVNNEGTDAHKLTYWELNRETNKFANLLLKIGAKKGEKILIILPQIPEWYYVVIGAIKLGIIVIPTPTLSTAHDLEYRITKSEAQYVVTDKENAPKIKEIQHKCPTLKKVIGIGVAEENWVAWDKEYPELSPNLDRSKVEETKTEDPMLIYFTSGTESYPKMVLHTQAYAIGHTVTAKYCQDLKPEDIIWVIADTGWAKTAWGKLFGQFIVGATVMQHNHKGKFSGATVLKIIEKFGPTVFCAPPTAFRMIILEDLKNYDLKSLRHCVSAGEPLNPEVIKVWKDATGLDIYDYYGQSESVALLSNFRCMPIKYGSMGKPTPGHVIEVVDDDGNILPVGEEGNIAVKVKPVHPPGIFKGYWKDEEKTQSCFRGDWYYTGDKAYKDSDGYFWFVGRADDVIKSSGYRIGPFEVESALQEHPAVAESAVIGVPDEMRGQIVKAFVILKPGYEPSEALVKELQEHVKKVTAPYKYPREIEFVKELPKTVSGKIKRAELRKMELAKRKK
ncbi:MAG: acyl--CoA ligase [Thermoplasmata archaeon]